MTRIIIGGIGAIGCFVGAMMLLVESRDGDGVAGALFMLIGVWFMVEFARGTLGRPSTFLRGEPPSTPQDR